MENKAFRIGGNILGITIGSDNTLDAKHKFLSLNFFPFMLIFMLGERDISLIIDIFNYLKVSLSLKTG